MKFNKSLVTAALLAVGSLAAVSASAATVNGSFNVKLKITSVCNVTAIASPTNDIDFGTVAAGIVPAEATSAAAIQVACSTGAPYVINLTPSNNNSLGLGQMTRVGGTATVNYQLRKTTGGAIWGNGGTVVNGTVTSVNNSLVGTGTGITNTISNPIYATTESTTDVQPGDYIDTVAVSVVY